MHLLHFLLVHVRWPRPRRSAPPRAWPLRTPHDSLPRLGHLPLLVRLALGRDHPRVLEQLPRADSEVRVLLEALAEKVAHDRARAVGERRAVVVDDPEESRHGVEEVVRRLAGDELDDERAERPDVGCRRRARLVDDFGRHPVGRADDGRVDRSADAGGHAKVGHCSQAHTSIEVSRRPAPERISPLTQPATHA